MGYLESITIVMCPLYCKSEDIGLASGFLGSTKQICGTIASKYSFKIWLEVTVSNNFSLYLHCSPP